jgi:hypothetical protein
MTQGAEFPIPAKEGLPLMCPACSHEERRGRVLTEEDMRALVEALSAHSCRFSDVDPADLRDIVEFAREIKKSKKEFNAALRTALIRILVWGAVSGLVGWIAYQTGAIHAFFHGGDPPIPPPSVP